MNDGHDCIITHQFLEVPLSEQRKTVYRASEFIPPVGQWTYVYNNSASLNSLYFVFVDVQADGVITKTELDSRAYPPNRPPQSLADIEALNIYPHGERLDSQTGNYYFTHWGRVQVDTNMALPSQFSVGDNWIEAIVFTPFDDLGNPIPPGSKGMSTSYITSDNMHFHWNSSYSALGNQVNTDRCVAVTASTNNLHVNRIFCAGVGVVSWGAPSTIENGIEIGGISLHLNSVLPGYVFPELPQN